MANLSDLVNGVMATAIGVPEPLAVAKYRDAARDFFFKTEAWRDVVTVAAVGGSTSEYEASVSDAEMFDAVYVRWDTRELSKATFQQMRYKAGSLLTNPATRYYRVAGSNLILYGDPGEDVAADLEVYAKLQPTRAATTLPDAHADRHGEKLEHGALARLLSMPSRPWTDYDGASFYWKLFLTDIDEWTSYGADEGMRGVPRTVRYGGY